MGLDVTMFITIVVAGLIACGIVWLVGTLVLVFKERKHYREKCEALQAKLTNVGRENRRLTVALRQAEEEVRMRRTDDFWKAECSIDALQDALREKDIMIATLKKQVERNAKRAAKA